MYKKTRVASLLSLSSLMTLSVISAIIFLTNIFIFTVGNSTNSIADDNIVTTNDDQVYFFIYKRSQFTFGLYKSDGSAGSGDSAEMIPEFSETSEVDRENTNQIQMTANMKDLRFDPSTREIYFSSAYNNSYTPSRYNIFKTTADGKPHTQLTPGPNSGVKYSGNFPSGKVSGTVKKTNGDPWSSAPVFIEGAGMVYTDAQGKFSFDKVPAGLRYIMGYRTASDVYQGMPLNIVENTSIEVSLSPYMNIKANFERPALYEDRVYFRNYPYEVVYMKKKSNNDHNLNHNQNPIETKVIYTSTSQGCTSYNVEGFDVAPKSGRVAIIDYTPGCPTNRGLYLTDKDGQNLSVLIDMKLQNSEWCGMKAVRWSADESKLAVLACYYWYPMLFIFDTTNWNLLGQMYFDKNLYPYANINLYDWSSNNEWLLVSYYSNDMNNGNLSKIKVNPNGSIDYTNIVNIISGNTIYGATFVLKK
ncbi:MAG: hypothetical protein HQK49_10920 [Oligoflexia bacterium]|nr:hypothetical protein [Oligoflexia bacterium]